MVVQPEPMRTDIGIRDYDQKWNALQAVQQGHSTEGRTDSGRGQAVSRVT